MKECCRPRRSLVVMEVTYAIVKVLVTEWHDYIQHHSNVITIWWPLAIKLTASLKNLWSEMKGVQEKESIMALRGR